MGLLLDIIAPVFFLIACGYVSARTQFVRPEATQALNDFALYFCVPALLFRTMQTVDLSEVSPVGIWTAYYLPVFALWILVGLAVRRIPGLDAAGGAAAAFGASFGNTGMMGLSLAWLAFGEPGLVIGAIVISVHPTIHWFALTLWAELSARDGTVKLGAIVRRVAVSLAKNPIVISLIVGAAWNAGGLPLPGFATRIVDLLADSAVPVGLFALGSSVARYPLRGNLAGVGTLLALKMALLPLLAWTMAGPVLHLPAMQASLITLFAAMPTGINAYFFATRFNASVPAVSGAIALGVILSVLTIPVVMAVMGTG